MGASRRHLYLTIGRRHIGAVECVGSKRSGGLPQVTAHLLRAIPRETDPSDPKALGAFIADALAEAGVAAKSATVCLERRDAVAKRLTFNGVRSPEAELPGLVRFQMQRQLTFPADDAAVDYTVLPAEEVLPERVDDAAGDGALTVLAVAAPGARVKHLRETVARAGLELAGTALTAEGTASLLARHHLADESGPVLVACPTPDGWEFSVALGPRCAAARWEAINTLGLARERGGGVPSGDDVPSIPLAPAPDRPEPQDPVTAIASESRRTWMSYQLAPTSTPIARAVLISEPDEAHTAKAAEALSSAVHVSPEVLPPGDVVPGLKVEGTLHSALIPLVGVAAEAGDTSARDRRIDVLNPRRPPDRAARVRQVALAGVLAVIAVVGGVWTVANREAGALEAELELLRGEYAEVATSRAEAIRRAARVEHIRRYLATGVSPLDQLASVVDIKPESERAILTRFAVGTDAEVSYSHDGRPRWYEDDRWSSAVLTTVSLRAAARSRADADVMRGLFVENESYTAETAGPDGTTTNDPRYPHRIDLTLTRIARDVLVDRPSAERSTVEERSDDQRASDGAGEGEEVGGA